MNEPNITKTFWKLQILDVISVMSEVKKIGIIQVDGKLPNLALMQIAQYYEDRGDLVEWYRGPMWARMITIRRISQGG